MKSKIKVFSFSNVLQNFPFTTSEGMGGYGYYLSTWYTRVASRVTKWLKTEDLSNLGNIRKVSKHQRMKG